MRVPNLQQTCEKNDLKICYINARSLLANFDEIELLCSKFRPAILACSEARITNDLYKCEYSIKDYNVVVCHSKSRRTGGCVI